MILSLPAALRVMAWLLTPWHFLLIYTVEVLELALALFGVATLLLITLRRYCLALAALALSAALAGAPARPRLPLRPNARYRFAVAQRRIVRPAGQTESPHGDVNIPSHATGPAVRDTARSMVTAQLDPEQRRVFDAALTAAESRTPTPVPALQRLPVTDEELLVIANDRVIGPLIEACRLAAGSGR